MASTTNFGWTTPDDTALVKDGAAAIRTLGSAIDTSLVDLKGGTTGQVLSKASNTDMDFTWVAQDDSNAIQNAIVDAKGDLISATAADTPARLAVGTNGQVLTADSTQSTGLAWTTISSGGMTLLSTTSLSGATTTISSISGSYNSLFMVYTGITNATAAGQFRIAPNGDTNLSNSIIQGAEGTGSSSGGGLNNNYIRYNYISTLDNTSANNAGFLWIYNYTSSSSYKPFQGSFTFINNTTTKSTETVSGAFYSNTAITSLVFSNSGGNLSTGTVLLYGVK